MLIDEDPQPGFYSVGFEMLSIQYNMYRREKNKVKDEI
jgi:hypothetical protein